MTQPLDADGIPVAVGPTVTLVTPGLEGDAEVLFPSALEMRGEEQLTPEFERALAATGIASQLTVLIRGGREVPTGGGVTRSTSYGEPAIIATVPGPADDEFQMLLAVDEAGAATWHLPEETTQGAATMRAASTRTYVVRRHVVATPDAGTTRGLLGTLGKKVLKVVAFKALDLVGGVVGAYFVKRWETAKRGYRVRSFTPDDYTGLAATDVDDAAWTRLGEGPALLFVHGTFSRAHAAFGRLPRADFAKLHDRYGGRVFAFEHPTASEDPTSNVREFLSRVRAPSGLEVDIVCHSRGGLVSRELAERASAPGIAGRKVRVRRVVFVAAPNSGTALTDPEHMGDFIDTYTNLLSFFPDNGVTDTLEIVISVLKQLAVGTLEGLDGLESMHPTGAWLKSLNGGAAPAGTAYHAITSNFEPKEPGLKEFAADRVVDAIFNGRPNDLVVPTDGVWDANGAGGFPIASRLILPESAEVGHSGYFGNKDVLAQLSTWLTVP